MRRRTFIGSGPLGIAGTVIAAGTSSAAVLKGSSVTEPEKIIPVIDNAEVIVLGGGPAGTAAAIAAARLGANVLLIERYGYLGGMATGGLVIMIGERDERIKGLPLEFVERILASDGRMVETGRTVQHEPFFNPETFKYTCLDMCRTAGVRLLFHAWAVSIIVNKDKIEAVIVESKSGRQAIGCSMVVDCTGDADTAAWADIPFENSTESYGLALDFIYGDVDYDRYRHFMTYSKDDWDVVMGRASKENIPWKPWYIGLHDQAWFNTHFKGNPADVLDLTACEIDLRTRIMKHLDFFRKNVPGFERATLLQTASQPCGRVSRRIIGEHVLTMEELESGVMSDRIGKVSGLKRGFVSDVPYGSLVPKKIENLLIAGRSISATLDALNCIRGITGCWVFGQAAGTAAVLSLTGNTTPRKLDVASLQMSLRHQGVEI